MKYLIILLYVISFQAFPSDYTYVNYDASDFFNEGRSSFEINVLSKTFERGDAIYEIEVCDTDSDYYCFSGAALAFYFPKRGASIGEKWTGGGRSFSALRNQSLVIFGTVKPVLVISSEQVDRFDYFFYSASDGLVAIKFQYKDKNIPIRFYMVTGSKGFPK